MLYRVSSAHEEGGDRVYSVSTQAFLGDDEGRVRALRLVEVELVDGRFTPVEGTQRDVPAQLVLLAMGFTGPERGPLLDQLGVELDGRGNVHRDDTYMSSVPGVFVAGDAGRGQSLIVWAIAEGRSCAAGVDRWLTGASVLPAPIAPTARAAPPPTNQDRTPPCVAPRSSAHWVPPSKAACGSSSRRAWTSPGST
jgi:glutamate synthase (NADPH/NADH) small chain